MSVVLPVGEEFDMVARGPMLLEDTGDHYNVYELPFNAS